MVKRLILLFLIFLFVYACAPKPPSYESATKWYSDCNPHPKYHPGDLIVAGYDFIIAINESGCAKECRKKYVCSEGRGYASCAQNRISCTNSCYEQIAKAHSVAYHIEGGYYSDGSYYASCRSLFLNIHPTADKYKKTKWQTDRDDCMKLTSKNVKMGFPRSATSYYKSCLEERGY